MEPLTAIAVALIGALATVAAARIAKEGVNQPNQSPSTSTNVESDVVSGALDVIPQVETDTQESELGEPQEDQPADGQEGLPIATPDAHGSQEKPAVLIVDDAPDEILWLLDRIEERGCAVRLATSEKAAKEALIEMAEGKQLYSVALFDVMVVTHDLTSLLDSKADLNEAFFEASKDSGIRLCHFARKTLGISEDRLPIACFSARNDEDLLFSLKEMNIRLFSRLGEGKPGSVLEFIDTHIVSES